MQLGLKGKNVIVTGGGSNIGRAIVHAFAVEGSNIVIAEIAPAKGRSWRRKSPGWAPAAG